MHSILPRTIFAAALLLTGFTVRANDLATEQFSLRYSAALSRLSTYPDVAGQAGASVASTRSTSSNPAALAWRPPTVDQQPLRFALSTQFNGTRFDRGTEIWAVTESVNYYVPESNFALKFAVTELRSNEEENRQGFIFETDANAYRLDLAWRFDRPEHPFAVGVQFNYSETETNFTLPELNFTNPVFGPLTVEKNIVADSDRRSFGVRFGWEVALIPGEAKAGSRGDGKGVELKGASALTTAPDRWMLGATVDYVYQPTKLGRYPRVPVGFRERPSSHDRQDYHQVLARVGTAYRYTGADLLKEKRVGYLRADYQWGWFGGNSAELQVHRLYVGGNYPVTAAVDLNAGTLIDDRRNVSWSAGISVHGYTWTVDVAYQHDLLPEIANNFGGSDTLVVSGALAF